VPLLAQDRLDPRLFDVLLLHRLGYDDRSRRDVPVLVTGTARGSAASAAAGRALRALPPARAGARTVRTLPVLGARSLRADKRSMGRFWTATRDRARSEPLSAAGRSGVEKTWLVGTLRVNLNQSVTQVGAPTAWRAGLTGKGVTVAVLDTGYDPKHPDLKGVVRRAKDFTKSPVGVRDSVGHGTHVAGIIAGRGKASGGRYVGVAKGASLAVGKVCDDFTCPEDAVLAGMEWAAATAKAGWSI
jgi:subtilisin family serine protease